MWNTVFGVTKEGKKAHRYILVNNKGMSVELSDFGALVLSIYVLDKYGRKRRNRSEERYLVMII